MRLNDNPILFFLKTTANIRAKMAIKRHPKKKSKINKPNKKYGIHSII
jgi:hypothetical protein